MKSVGRQLTDDVVQSVHDRLVSYLQEGKLIRLFILVVDNEWFLDRMSRMIYHLNLG
jgi:hypothetical protein